MTASTVGVGAEAQLRAKGTGNGMPTLGSAPINIHSSAELRHPSNASSISAASIAPAAPVMDAGSNANGGVNVNGNVNGGGMGGMGGMHGISGASSGSPHMICKFDHHFLPPLSPYSGGIHSSLPWPSFRRHAPWKYELDERTDGRLEHGQNWSPRSGLQCIRLSMPCRAARSDATAPAPRLLHHPRPGYDKPPGCKWTPPPVTHHETPVGGFTCFDTGTCQPALSSFSS